MSRIPEFFWFFPLTWGSPSARIAGEEFQALQVPSTNLGGISIISCLFV